MADGKVRNLAIGANQSGLRAHNERLLLSMLQRHGAMPGSDIARRTGLSPQTVSVILRKLENDGLLARGKTVAGKVGKPSVPMGMNPRGLFSFGLKIGRRSADLLLLDFRGTILKQLSTRYAYPMPGPVFGFLKDGLAQITAALAAPDADRICGIGIAAPFELWNWHEQVGAPQRDLDAWKGFDFAAETAAFSDLPVFVMNDATAACQAEHMFGRGKEFRDYAYFFVGAFIGGGIVLSHSVYEGTHGNAGAMGPLPSPGPDGRERKLIDTASIHVLESSIEADGGDPAALWTRPQDWSALALHVDPWIEQTADALARASLAICAVIDFEAVLIDGAMPEDVKHRLVERTRRHLTTLDARGLIVPRIEEGVIGANARAIGAASGPIVSQFLLDSHAGFYAAGPIS